jgi:MurE/MurF fusion protein
MTSSNIFQISLREAVAMLGDAQLVHGDADVQVGHITTDSRQVRAGSLFIAAPGATDNSQHGRAFVDAARRAGAAGIVVTDSVMRLGLLFERLHNHPSRRAQVIGITGTNGKTTSTFLLAQLVSKMGGVGRVMGTLGVGTPDAPTPTGYTTPTAEVVSSSLAQLCAEVQPQQPVVAMEVSSHALASGRVEGVHFAAGAFTNFTQDHLDFHHTMEAYFNAKARLLRELVGVDAPVVVAADLIERLSAPQSRVWSFGGAGDVRAEGLQLTSRGMSGRLCTPAGSASFSAPLVGAFNVDNVLVAAGLLVALGRPVDAVAAALSDVHAPPGRMQYIAGPAGDTKPTVLVDYAHTPDALTRALETVRGVSQGRVWVVFGCGGNRDPLKRPMMGAIAASLADRVLLTDDNPRNEVGSSIIDDIVDGLPMPAVPLSSWSASSPVAREPNRRLAIRTVIDHADADDVVLIAGKGHELGQLSGGVTRPFSDVREASRALHGKTSPADLLGSFVGASLGVPASLPVTSLVLAGVSTDSRAIEPGSLFVALKGNNFDGHEYVDAALRAGAAGALIEEHPGAQQAAAAAAAPVWVVPNALVALQTLAREHVLQQPALRIGLTGSNGKTTTKELLLGVLREAMVEQAVMASEGNLNNHIGVPLTALRVEPHHRVAIFEMGMNHLGEIADYCRVVTPSIGLVTNMGSAHAGNVGGLDGVAAAKAELWEAVANTPGGILVVNADDARCVREAQRIERTSGCRLFTFGRSAHADVHLSAVLDDGDGQQRLELRCGRSVATATLPIDGAHNAVNAAAAVAVGVAMGMALATAAAGLARTRFAAGRMQRRQRSDGLLLLDDSYNANPDSMAAALTTLHHLAGQQHPRRAVAALGVMLELGELAAAAHERLGHACAHAGVQKLFVCGDHGRLIAAGALAAGLTQEQVHWAVDSAALAPLVQQHLHSDDVLLVKGSRGARMERVVNLVMASSGDR